MPFKILVINPGGTSTKVALFQDREILFKKTVEHNIAELSKYKRIFDQKEFRTEVILKTLLEEKVNLEELDAVIGRGGIVKPIEGGVYHISKALIEDMIRAEYGEHASNLGAAIVKDIADRLDIPSYIMDPVSVDEMEPVARISGLKELPRISQLHTLNSRAVAREVGEERGKKYEEMRLIVAHLGAGISITPHVNGRIIDCNNPLEGGPFCPDRAGGLPAKSLIKLCYSGKYETARDMITKVTQQGGLYDHLGTKDLREAEKMAADGNEYAKVVLEAMAYQIAKEIAAMAAVLYGKVDYIILTGGMAYSERLVRNISERVGFIAEILVKPGENEMEALAYGALRCLRKEDKAREYK